MACRHAGDHDREPGADGGDRGNAGGASWRDGISVRITVQQGTRCRLRDAARHGLRNDRRVNDEGAPAGPRIEPALGDHGIADRGHGCRASPAGNCGLRSVKCDLHGGRERSMNVERSDSDPCPTNARAARSISRPGDRRNPAREIGSSGDPCHRRKSPFRGNQLRQGWSGHQRLGALPSSDRLRLPGSRRGSTGGFKNGHVASLGSTWTARPARYQPVRLRLRVSSRAIPARRGAARTS